MNLRILRAVCTLATLLGLCLDAFAVNLSGAIKNNQGTPICGLVLANGQFTFSCSPTGTYSLTGIPLDASGQITLFGFAEGHFPFKTVLGGAGGIHDITLTIAANAAEDNRAKTERLLGGTWTLLYTIISAFSQTYTFTSVLASSAAPGDYNALGTDQFGDPVVGGYNSQSKAWGILDPSILLDRFYIFTFTDNNRISGCYHQITPPGSLNLGTCYPMTGSRFPQKTLEQSLGDMREEDELLEGLLTFDSATPPATPEVREQYLRARELLRAR